jgi:subtilisin family serine protease
VDPASASGDREKPEIAAVGTDIISTNMAGGSSLGGSGTSLAAPVISGVAACLIQAEPVFGIWPEAVKAVVMAAAAHNVEGAARLSDGDGAGCLNGLQAYRIVERRQYMTGTFLPGSFNVNGFWVQDIFLSAGDRTRICLCWTSTSRSSRASSRRAGRSWRPRFRGTTTTRSSSSARR